MKKILFYLLFLLTLNACKKETDDMIPESKPEFKDYSDIKSDNWETKIGQPITVEGYLIQVAPNTYKIINDTLFAKANTIMPNQNYILVQTFPTPETEEAFGNFSSFTGEKVKATGLLAKFSPRNALDESMNYSAEFLGSKSLATIALNILPVKLGGKKFEMAVKNLGEIIDLNAIRQLPANRTKFALLYSGGVDAMQAYSHYYNNMQSMYYLLLKQGYDSRNIVVVYKDGAPDGIVPSTSPPYFKSYPSIPVNYPATPSGLDQAIDYLKKMMTGQNAELFLMTTNHGGGYHAVEKKNYSGLADLNNDEPAQDSYKIDEVITFYNTNRFISDDEFAKKINSLPFVALKALFLQCFSGGFIYDLRGANRVLMSATTETEFSWGGGYYDIDFFCMNFISPYSLFGVSPLNNIVDINLDGSLSMYEIFRIADSMQKDQNKKYPKYTATPQYDDDGDGIPNTPTATGFGSRITL